MNSKIKTSSIKFTEGAIKKVQDSLKAGTHLGIRLIVHRNSGEFQYQFSYVEKGKADPQDIKLQCGTYAFYIEKSSFALIQGSVIDYVHTGLTNAWVIENPNPPWDSELASEISKMFDELINPGVAEHGGHIRLVGLKESIAYVEMSGGCQGCSMAGKTLYHGVMKVLSQKFPQITDLIDVTDHSAGSKPFFQTEDGNIPMFKS